MLLDALLEPRPGGAVDEIMMEVLSAFSGSDLLRCGAVFIRETKTHQEQRPRLSEAWRTGCHSQTQTKCSNKSVPTSAFSQSNKIRE